MKNGKIERIDGEELKRVYKKLNLNGTTKEPLTAHEMVLIYCVGNAIEKGERPEASNEQGSCVGCKWWGEDADGPHCTGCTQNAINKYEVATNADRVRNMDDHELTEWLAEMLVKYSCGSIRKDALYMFLTKAADNNDT